MVSFIYYSYDYYDLEDMSATGNKLTGANQADSNADDDKEVPKDTT